MTEVVHHSGAVWATFAVVEAALGCAITVGIVAYIRIALRGGDNE